MVRRFLTLSLVLLGGCLDRNPLFVDPTEGGTQADSDSDGGGPTSAPGTDSQPTSVSEPTTTPPPTTAGPGETTSAESTGPTIDTEAPSSTGMPPPACGDGVKDPGEECDLGNQDPSGECPKDCKKATCGDGFWWMDGGEECDDGNNVDDDMCNNMCKYNYCGDGVVQMGLGETCEDGNDISSDSCVKCESAKCGDNEVYQGKEECDDGNDVSGDGCEPFECKKTVKFVFVSSKAYKASELGGLMGAHAKCKALAMAAALPPGAYFAWLGDSVNNGPKDFMKMSPYPYVKTNMVMVAMSWNGLISGNLLAPIDITEQKQPAPDINHSCGPNPVHSNAKPDGNIVDKGYDCGNWQSDGGKGRWGVWKATGKEWTDTTCAAMYCGEPARLYCVQQ